MTNAKNTMLCWKPGTNDVMLTPWPDYENRSAKYYTGLACYTHIREMDFEDRKKMVFITAIHLIVRDGCTPDAVHRALLGLEEYRDGCSDDMPGIKR